MENLKTRHNPKFHFRVFLIFVNLLMFNHTHAADHVFYPDDGYGHIACSIDGNLVEEDIFLLDRHVQRGCKMLYLSSPGGDVSAALTMGRIIRSAEMSVVVKGDGQCASACIFLYAGGVIRAPYGPVAIHRPYLRKSSKSFRETQDEFNSINLSMKKYLREMNVNESLVDQMMTISPENSVKLTLDEMQNFGLGLNDQIYQEYLENKNAALAGISKHDWLLKKVQTTKTCGALPGVAVPGNDAKSRIQCWRKQFPEYYPMQAGFQSNN